MRALTTGILLAGAALAGTWGLGGVGQAGAQEQAKVSKTAQGGLVATTPHHQFEVFFYPTGVRVFPRTTAGQPLDVSRASATATFYHPNSPRPWFSRPLAAGAAAPGQEAPSSLEHAIGLANVPASGVRVTFEVTGLSGPGGSTATFTVPFEFAPVPSPTTTTQPAATTAGAASVPRYVYGYGNAGYGYYPYTSPGTAAPRVTANTYHGRPMPFPGADHEVGPNHRDWSTGRDVRLAKPWLQPFDD
jgi:hypothetical protein